jgi:hypothetical protein
MGDPAGPHPFLPTPGKLASFRTFVPAGACISGLGSASVPAGPGQIGFVSHDRSRRWPVQLCRPSVIAVWAEIGFVLHN